MERQEWPFSSYQKFTQIRQKSLEKPLGGKALIILIFQARFPSTVELMLVKASESCDMLQLCIVEPKARTVLRFFSVQGRRRITFAVRGYEVDRLKYRESSLYLWNSAKETLFRWNYSSF